MTSNVIQPAGIGEVAVIGLGLMGSGIAELVARSGRRVVAIEISQDFLDQGMARLNASLDKAVSRGKLTGTGRAEMLARIRPAVDIAAGVAGADLVIEAIPERMDLKRTLYARLDEACRADAILATNTSSLSVTEIAGGTRYPARVAGLHFFNPAPVMKLVEVISTVLTSPQTAEALALLARDLGKTPVQVSDRAGFIVNALLVPYLNHAIRLLETAQATREDIDKAAAKARALAARLGLNAVISRDRPGFLTEALAYAQFNDAVRMFQDGYASPADIDTAMMLGCGYPRGPLQMLDDAGPANVAAVLDAMHAATGDPAFTPVPLLAEYATAGTRFRS